MSQIEVNKVVPLTLDTVDVNNAEISANDSTFSLRISNYQVAVPGDYNTMIGSETGVAVSTGQKNVLLGWRAGTGNSGAGGSISTGSNNVLIGTNGFDVVPTLSNTIILGDASTSTLACQVTSITSLSDGRDKKDVEALPIGLDFINELNPVKFVWDDRDENGKHDVKDCGFIAQDLEEVVPEMVFTDDEGWKSVNYGQMVSLGIGGIQEQKRRVDSIYERINKLKQIIGG